MNTIRPEDTRLVSIIEAAKAHAKAAGIEGHTLEDKQIAVLGFTHMLTLAFFPARLPAEIAEMFSRCVIILAPELNKPENLPKLKTISHLFNLDMKDLVEGKIQGFGPHD